MKLCNSCGEIKPYVDFEETRNICRPCRSLQKKLQKFNITQEEYNLMFAKQQGCCGICGKHQTEFNKALAIDHCHITGAVRGLLCMPCNTALGKFNDDEKLLNAAIDYLRSS